MTREEFEQLSVPCVIVLVVDHGNLKCEAVKFEGDEALDAAFEARGTLMEENPTKSIILLTNELAETILVDRAIEELEEEGFLPEEGEDYDDNDEWED